MDSVVTLFSFTGFNKIGSFTYFKALEGDVVVLDSEGEWRVCCGVNVLDEASAPERGFDGGKEI